MPKKTTKPKAVKQKWKKGDCVTVRSRLGLSDIGVGFVIQKNKPNWESKHYGEDMYLVKIGCLTASFPESSLS